MRLELRHSHPWDLTPAEAVSLQRRLAGLVEKGDALPPRKALTRVAGVDVGFEDQGRITRAAVVLLTFPDLVLVESAVARVPTTFPYVPGLLSFREIPAVLAALEGLQCVPDVLLCDGQGYAHPRRFGIACHLGVLTGLPSVGVAKTRLLGRHGEVPAGRGEWCPLSDHDEIIGAVLRSRPGVKPLYVSLGHRVSLATAVELVMACCTRYRLPETTRHAHRLASG